MSEAVVVQMQLSQSGEEGQAAILYVTDMVIAKAQPGKIHVSQSCEGTSCHLLDAVLMDPDLNQRGGQVLWDSGQQILGEVQLLHVLQRHKCSGVDFGNKVCEAFELILLQLGDMVVLQVQELGVPGNILWYFKHWTTLRRQWQPKGHMDMSGGRISSTAEPSSSSLIIVIKPPLSMLSIAKSQKPFCSKGRAEVVESSRATHSNSRREQILKKSYILITLRDICSVSLWSSCIQPQLLRH
ncbi:hypothetical protein F7725_000769 [Dissostichus mawsoni]|uniref:Uncharacterized protein n=1 Tax=Dissostichus mawsoni TaxID=36200 RepID=A0A7J5ZFC9_DISMA|nr:hypothetical protein F7725_000769 [Dissostichus mawsoni]